jgi:hypothetical protein
MGETSDDSFGNADSRHVGVDSAAFAAISNPATAK